MPVAKDMICHSRTHYIENDSSDVYVLWCEDCQKTTGGGTHAYYTTEKVYRSIIIGNMFSAAVRGNEIISLIES